MEVTGMPNWLKDHRVPVSYGSDGHRQALARVDGRTFREMFSLAI
jgi:hypothetical protein